MGPGSLRQGAGDRLPDVVVRANLKETPRALASLFTLPRVGRNQEGILRPAGLGFAGSIRTPLSFDDEQRAGIFATDLAARHEVRHVSSPTVVDAVGDLPAVRSVVPSETATAG